jgi:glucosamine--fructose-6-phosphate aminotransferase (isomerizing)
MCGIVGYVGTRDAVPVIIEGLRKLEYRGYDSAGVAVVRNGELKRRRAAGKPQNLELSLKEEPLSGDYGVGHTRWATHGRPTEENAHPHQDTAGRIVVVHNGIIENYLPLKAKLQAAGHVFVTQTDTEVIAHLVSHHYQGSLEEALLSAVRELEGIYALVLLHKDEPQVLVGARLGPPLVVGLGEGENFLASDIPALLPYTRDFLFLEDGEVVTVRPGSVVLKNGAGAVVTRAPQRIAWDPVQAEKGGYRHFMLKEIHEQPRAVRDSLLGRIGLEEGGVHLEELGEAAERLKNVRRVVLLACGTSWHAGLVGKFLLEQVAGIPAEVDYGSEFRYRTPIVDADTLAVAISQSGETADTLAAFREAKRKGALPIGICNVQGSMLTREAAGSLLTHAGPEIGVASTKAFTAQLTAVTLLALRLGQARRLVDPELLQQAVKALWEIPDLIEGQVARSDEILAAAMPFAEYPNFLYLGRGLHFPLALEGALKLKEISYIHAEGHAAGEMKHGPIALIDRRMPVVAIAPVGPTYDKMCANVEEVKARDGIVIAVAEEGDEAIRAKADVVIPIPAASSYWTQPLLVAPQLQLWAYHLAVLRGCDVDQPRNLAKSVTVE